jgi:hypothetical protein
LIIYIIRINFGLLILEKADPEGLGKKTFKIETQWIRTFIASVSEPY